MEKMRDEETMEKRIRGGNFKQFDIIKEASSFSDNHYYKRRPKKYSDRLQNKIYEEWIIFKEQLPDSIFVRANRERPDLLQAVIIGPQGSPYHDGLFFLDIKFPSKYPNVRPNIHYRCYDVKSMSEYIPFAVSEIFTPKDIPWCSSTSTVLELLVLIRDILVCTANTIHREPATLFYDEEIFKDNWETMVSVLKKPPNCFEEFVTQHFHDQAKVILTTCKAYIKGRMNAVDLPVPTRIAFGEMERIYYKLVSAFEKNGFSLENLCKLGIEFQRKPSMRRRIAACIGII